MNLMESLEYKEHFSCTCCFLTRSREVYACCFHDFDPGKLIASPDDKDDLALVVSDDRVRDVCRCCVLDFDPKGSLIVG